MSMRTRQFTHQLLNDSRFEWLRRIVPSYGNEQNSEAHIERLLRAKAEQHKIDYRDRISVVTWIMVLGLGLSLFVDLPPIADLNFVAFSTPVSIVISGNLFKAAVLALLAATGTQSVIGVHTAFRSGQIAPWYGWAFWALPIALTIIATFLLPLAPTRVIQVIALILGGALFAMAQFSLFATIERGQSGFRRGRLILNAMAYGSALLLFLFVYQTRTRSLISASVISITATLLAVEILRNTSAKASSIYMYSAITGMVLGQVTWALNYWPLLPGLTGGLLLLLTFYLLVGVAQQGLDERFSFRILIEFAIFTIIALVLIAVVGPGY